MEQGISTYVRFGQGQVNRLKDMAFADLGRPAPLLLEVVDGMQQGSMSIVETQNFTIGDSFDDDVLLLDGQGQVTLSPKQTAIGTLVTVETERSDVFIDGKQVSVLSDPLRVPFEIQIAESRVVISKAVDTLDQVPTSSRLPYLQMAGVFLLVLVGCAALIATSQKSMRVVGHQVDNTPAELAQRMPIPQAQALLANSRFSERITFNQVDATTYSLVGNVPQNDGASWLHLRQEFDAVFDGFTLLNNVTVTPTLVDVPAVSMVLVAPDPVVILMNGQKVEIGMPLTNGWILTEIADQNLYVSRNGDTIAVAY